MIKRFSFKELPIGNRAKEYLYGRLDRGRETVSENVFFFGAYKDLKFPQTELKISIEENRGRDIKIKVEASNYARIVELNLASKMMDFSDNYFDILPRQVKIIKAKGNFEKGDKVVVRALNSSPHYELRGARNEA